MTIGLSIRQATLQDQNRIANLIYFEPHVHRHLDWRSPLDWLGTDEYWVAEMHGAIAATLACPPDPEKVAWMRLFARSGLIPLQAAWNELWGVARQVLEQRQMQVASISLSPWYEQLLQGSGFNVHSRIVVLQHSGILPEQISCPVQYNLRPMYASDLPAIAALDAISFDALWQNSERSLQLAFSQAGVATVLEYEGELMAYQISTKNPFGAHLARLAVHPAYRGRGLGYLLVQNLLQQTLRLGMGRVTVNTQDNNTGSLKLYQKMGFRLTGEQYPVYEYSYR